MQLQLLPREVDGKEAEAWLVHLLNFLDEDKAWLSQPSGYVDNFEPGPAHQLEQRILHWQPSTASAVGCRHCQAGAQPGRHFGIDGPASQRLTERLLWHVAVGPNSA